MADFAGFIRRRLARDSATGLPLTVAMAVVAAGLAVFLAIAAAVGGESGLVALDMDIARAMQAHSADHPAALYAARFLTHLGGIPFMIAVGTVGTVTMAVRKHYVLALGWALTAGSGALVNMVLKDLVERERPPRAMRDEAVTEDNLSYPSGHAMGAAVGYGVAGYMLAVTLRRRAVKRWLLAGLALLVVGIAWSRVYLRAHWFSDVVGGVAVGLAWAALCLTVVEVFRRRALPRAVG